MTGPLLAVDDLAVHFASDAGPVHAVDGLSFTIERGQTLGIVGESGCGKSTAAMAVLGLLPAAARIAQGSVRFDGHDLVGRSERELRRIRGRRAAVVFQDPMTSLNPYLTVEAHFRGPLRTHLGLGRVAAREKTIALLKRVGLPDPAARLGRHPHEFSGGQRQRLMIALALSCDPDLLIADEPTTALDVTIQAQILDLLADLQAERGLGLVLITHDLGVVAGVTDDVLVMYAGRAVETGSTRAVFTAPTHPYTRALLAAIPHMGSERGRALQTIPGQPPRLVGGATGCAFAPRCPLATAACRSRVPLLEPVTPGHRAACPVVLGAEADVAIGKQTPAPGP